MRLHAAILMLTVNAASAQIATHGGASMANYSFAAVEPDPLSNSVAINYRQAIAENGGTASTSDLVAVQAFVESAQSAGYWGYITDCSPFAGNNTNAAVVKLVSHSLSQTGGKVALYASTSDHYTRTVGWTFQGSNYLWPGLVCSNAFMAWNTNGVAIWVGGFLTNAAGQLWGNENNAGRNMFYGYANGYNARFLGSAGGEYLFPSFSDSYRGYDEGLISVSRTNDASAKWFVNGEAQNTLTHTITNEPDGTYGNYVWTLGGRYAGAAPLGASDRPAFYRIGFYAVHNGIPYNLQSNLYADVRTLMRSLGRLPNRTVKRLGLVATGQSNSYGEGASDPASGYQGTSAFSNLVGGATAYFYANAAHTNFFRNRTLATEYEKYSGWFDAMEQLSSMAPGTNSVLMSFGKNGASYGALCAGTEPFAYSTNWAAKQNALELELYQTNLSFPAVLCVHGENDSSVSTYSNLLANWQRDYQISLNAINGTTNKIPMLHSQIAAYAQGSDQHANIGMLSAHETSSGSNVLVMPKYQLSYGSDGIHLDKSGYQRMGEQYGYAVFKLLSQGYYEPVRPIDISLSTITITLTYTGVVGSLTLDTNTFAWLANKSNYGFSYTDSAAHTISAVALSGTNKVVITLSGDASGSTGRVLGYADNSTTNSIYCAGTAFTPGGNLRDTNSLVGFRTGSNLWNWAVMFKKAI